MASSRPFPSSCRPAGVAAHASGVRVRRPAPLPRLRPVAVAVVTLLALGSAAAQVPPTNALPVRNPGVGLVNATIGAQTGDAAAPVMNINQNAARAVIEWQSFNIGQQARVNIVQPSAQSVLVNRVTQGNATGSQIHGALNANGRVFVVNPAGVTFGATAKVSVGSLVATTLDLAPAMVANNYAALVDPATTTIPLVTGVSGGLQVDTGASLIADPNGGGSIVLVGNSAVVHAGTIEALRGRVALATGGTAQVTLPASDSGFIDVVVTQPSSLRGAVDMGSGARIDAEGGSVVIGSGAGGAVRDESVFVDGRINVGSTTGAAGSIVVDASADGSVVIGDSAHLGAVGDVAGQRGGTVAVTGRTVEFEDRSTRLEDLTPVVLAQVPNERGTIDASGRAGGGIVTLGGDTTRRVRVRSGNTLHADALDAGDGGQVTVRAMYLGSAGTGTAGGTDFGMTEVYGRLTARGGDTGGNGGRIETSGQALTTRLSNGFGTVAIAADAGAPAGAAGTWTIEPFNVTITNAVPGAQPSSDFTWAPTVLGAIVNAADLAAALDAGTSVTVTTGSPTAGNQAGNITVAQGTAVARTVDGGITTLTLRAQNDVVLAGADISGTATAPLALVLHSDADGNGAGGVVVTGGSVRTGGGDVTIGGGTDFAIGFAGGGGGKGSVILDGAVVDTTGAAGAGRFDARGRGAAGTGETGVLLNNATVRAGQVDVLGQSDGGTGTSVDSGILAAADGLTLRGSSTRSNGNGAQAVGVSLEDAVVSVATAALRVSGRGDDNGVGGEFAGAVGVQASGTTFVSDAAAGQVVQIAGEAAGSTNAGLVLAGSEGGATTIRAGVSENTPTLADVSLGATSSDGLAYAVGFGTGGAAVRTTGALNFRPVSVDANGAVTAANGVRIQVGSSGEFGTGFFVDPQSLGAAVRADAGLVLGSTTHTGQIAVADGALGGLADRSVALQNTGSGSAGIALGAGTAVGNLGLLSGGAVTQAGGFAVAGTLVVGGGGTFDLTAAGNTVGGAVALARPDTVALTVDGALTLGTGAALAGFDSATGTSNRLQVDRGAVDRRGVLRSTNGAVTVSHGVGTGEGGELALVSPTAIAVDGASSLTGGRVQLWSPTITWGATDRVNYYGCEFPACAAGVVPAPTGLQALFPDRPTLVVTADPVTVTAGQPLPPLTFTATGFLNGDTAATALGGALATAATATSAPGTYAIDQGTLVSPTGYLVTYAPAALTLAPTARTLAGFDLGREAVRATFLAQARSDVYGRNLDQPFICTAASVIQESVAREAGADPLAAEWGKVRNQPQLSGCLNVSSAGQCAAF